MENKENLPQADLFANILDRDINEEMKSSYIDYSMSVIVGRALPDVRDGLKPVHRRVLYTMNEMGVRHNKPTKKSARIVGDVMGKYHPHGDASIYDTLVRLAQPFNLRYTLVEGQGNFGSVDGDPAAAMRYTEARLETISNEMLDDLEKALSKMRMESQKNLKRFMLLQFIALKIPICIVPIVLKSMKSLRKEVEILDVNPLRCIS